MRSFIAFLNKRKFLGIIPEPYIKGTFSNNICIAIQLVIPPDKLNKPIMRTKLLLKGLSVPIKVINRAIIFVKRDLFIKLDY